MTVLELSEKLKGLHQQAVNERSHFYVGTLAREAVEALAEMSKLVSESQSAMNYYLMCGPLPETGQQKRAFKALADQRDVLLGFMGEEGMDQ